MAHTTQDHIDMINSPSEWPRWPVLPLKNPGRYNTQTCDHGVILAYGRCHSPENGIVVFYANMFSIPAKEIPNSANDGTHSIVDFEALEAMGFEIYPDAEAIIDAGWVVD